MTNISYGCARHIGYVRDHDEDLYLAAPELGLWLVADGMGGHVDGEIASAVVIEHVQGRVSDGTSLLQAVTTAHRAVLDAPLEGRGSAGMGSTVVGVHIRKDHYEVVWVGDSRAYLWDRYDLQQLSADHSYIQELIDNGEITPELAANHPYRGMLTRCIGGNDNAPVEAETESGNLTRGQRILLCSDGLHSEVSDEEIEAILKADTDAQEAADRLVQRALEHGGSDNVTVVVISADDFAE